MSDRVACKVCGKWMFHLAKTCPHCGAPQSEAAPAPVAAVEKKAPPKKIEISAEEARSLLAASAPDREPRMKDVAAELVLPRGGTTDLVLTLIALPVTALTLAVLGYGVLQTMRKKLPINLTGARWLAVPTSTALLAMLFVQHDAPTAAWVAVGISLGAWIARDLLRARAKSDPLY